MVEADHQVVRGPGGRHVQEAEVLGLVGLLLQGGPFVVARRPHRGRHPDLGPAVPPQDHLGVAVRSGPVEPGEEDHGEFEALGGVDGHDPHGVVVGLRQDDLDGPHLLRLLEVHPREEPVQVATVVVGELPGLVGDEAEPPPRVAGPAVVEGELHHPPDLDHLLHQPAHVEPPVPSVELPQHGQGPDHRVVPVDVHRERGQVVPGPPAAA